MTSSSKRRRPIKVIYADDDYDYVDQLNSPPNYDYPYNVSPNINPYGSQRVGLSSASRLQRPGLRYYKQFF